MSEQIILAGLKETKALAEDNPEMAYRPLYENGPLVSEAGFGCYRVAKGVKAHEQALIHALKAGINLIDVSSNYTGGNAEAMVGGVLKNGFASGRIERGRVVVVTKAGYLQGDALTEAKKREEQGSPYQDVVCMSDDLWHSIHPDFLKDQLEASLMRLNLKAVDCFLLHNPEYYLNWANKQGVPLDDARNEYYNRIAQAFEYLEDEARLGRIGAYGISSNSFGYPAEAHDFTSLDGILKNCLPKGDAGAFKLIQLPLNLLECGAAVEANQSGGHTVLELARQNGLGVLINRPLNAIYKERLIRLSDPEPAQEPSEGEILHAISLFRDSEDVIRTSLLPNMEISEGASKRISGALDLGQTIITQWNRMEGLEHWRALEGTYLIPRVNGTCQFLSRRLEKSQEGLMVLDRYLKRTRSLFEMLGNWYLARAGETAASIRAALTEADPDWAPTGALSQAAIGALRSTEGVSSVLVGMRSEDYVEDVLAGLKQKMEQKDRKASWQKLAEWMTGEGPKL